MRNYSVCSYLKKVLIMYSRLNKETLKGISSNFVSRVVSHQWCTVDASQNLNLNEAIEISGSWQDI